MTGSNTSIRTKTRHPADFFTYVAIYVCAILSVALLLGIIVYVFVKGIRSVNWEFLTSVTSVLKGTTGIAGNIVNTLYIIIVTMLIATPISSRLKMSSPISFHAEYTPYIHSRA